MVVRHPDYGLGKITAIGGVGPKRAATIQFASAAGEKKFLLIHSRLTPAKSGYATRHARRDSQTPSNRGKAQSRNAPCRLVEQVGQGGRGKGLLHLGQRRVHFLVQRTEPLAVRLEPQRTGLDPLDGIEDRHRLENRDPIGRPAEAESALHAAPRSTSPCLTSACNTFERYGPGTLVIFVNWRWLCGRCGSTASATSDRKAYSTVWLNMS